MAYIHYLPQWPQFKWDDEALVPSLSEVRHRQGRLIGRMEMLGFGLQAEASLEALTEEVVKSSEIEGEVLDRDQVRSSLARRLGMDVAGLVPADRARCNAELHGTPHQRSVVRMARRSFPHRSKRADEDHRWRLAYRSVRANASRVRRIRARESPL